MTAQTENPGPPPGERPKARAKKIALAAAIVGLSLYLAAVAMYARVQACGDDLRTVETAAPMRVGIVFGAKVYPDGDASYPLEVRLRAALELYRAGKVKKLLVSGDNRWSHYNEPERMKEWLVAAGVPSEDVGCDYAGRRTLDTCARAAKVWRLEEAILVTQRYHLPRALYLARAWGLRAEGVAADGLERETACRRDRLREIAACVAAWLDVNVFGTQPALLGKPETI